MKKDLLKKVAICVALFSMTLLCSACNGNTPDSPQEPPVENPEDTPEEEPEDKPEDNPEDKPQISDQGWEKAEEAIVNMGLGWNLGNTLDSRGDNGHDGGDWEYWENFWGQSTTTPELMQMLKDAGYGAVRVPVTWGIHMDANGRVHPNWMNRVKEIVGYVLDAGMYCILNVHHDTGDYEGVWLEASMRKYEANKERYEGLWKQIAETFKEYDHRLLFESYNEMLDERHSWCFSTFAGGYNAEEAADAYKAINSYAQSFVDVVRATGGNNAGRNLIVNTYGASCGSGTWNPHLIDPLVEMKLPTDVVEGHLLFEVHTYPDITNLENAKSEVTSMIANLKKYLVAKGAPVIIGEWGSGGESEFTIESKSAFIYDFVKQAKAADMGIFYWMGISDGMARQLPAFSDPEYAMAMLKAYHGDDYTVDLPTMDSMDYSYVVTYKDRWSEVHLCDHTISLDEYKGVKVELESKPADGVLSIKVYGESEGKEQYNGVSSAEVEVMFDRAIVGDEVRRVTLQCGVSEETKTTIKRAVLIKQDGTEEEQIPSVFWGCIVGLQVNN